MLFSGEKVKSKISEKQYFLFCSQLLIWTKFSLVVFVVYEMVAADINIE